MAFDIVETMRKARRVVHDTFGVPALYTDSSVSEPQEIMARWHNKIDRFGDPEQLGFAEIIQGIDRIILIPTDYPGLTFVRGGRVEFPCHGNAFILDALEPSDGPLQQIWKATEA